MARVDIPGTTLQETMDKFNLALKNNSLVQFIGNIEDDESKTYWNYYKIKENDGYILRVTSKIVSGKFTAQLYQGDLLPVDNNTGINYITTMFSYSTGILDFFAVLDTDFICARGLLIIRMHKIYDLSDIKIKTLVCNNTLYPDDFGERLTNNLTRITSTLLYCFAPDGKKENQYWGLMDLYTLDGYTYLNGVYLAFNGSGGGDEVPVQLVQGRMYVFNDIKTGKQYKLRCMRSCMIGGY